MTVPPPLPSAPNSLRPNISQACLWSSFHFFHNTLEHEARAKAPSLLAGVLEPACCAPHSPACLCFTQYLVHCSALPQAERPRQGTAGSVICDEEALQAEAKMVGTRGTDQGLHIGCSSLITLLSACFGSHCEDCPCCGYSGLAPKVSRGCAPSCVQCR